MNLVRKIYFLPKIIDLAQVCSILDLLDVKNGSGLIFLTEWWYWIWKLRIKPFHEACIEERDGLLYETVFANMKLPRHGISVHRYSNHFIPFFWH